MKVIFLDFDGVTIRTIIHAFHTFPLIIIFTHSKQIAIFALQP